MNDHVSYSRCHFRSCRSDFRSQRQLQVRPYAVTLALSLLDAPARMGWDRLRSGGGAELRDVFGRLESHEVHR